MKATGSLFVMLAVVLVQVPWIPCHCEGTCTPRPVLGADVHDCDDGRESRPARVGCGCAHHASSDRAHHHARESSRGTAPAPDDDAPDHDHDLVFLQAVTPASGPVLDGPGAAPLALVATSVLGMVPDEAAPRAMVRAPPDPCPPDRLASVRLLL